MNFPLLSGHYIDTTDFMSDNTPGQIKTPAPLQAQKLKAFQTSILMSWVKSTKH